MENMPDLWLFFRVAFLTFVDQKSTDNQSCSFVVREVTPDPVVQGDQLISETDQVQDMHKHPNEPGEKSFYMQTSRHIHNGFVPTDSRHGAFV